MAFEHWTEEEKKRRAAKQLFKLEIIFRVGPETKIIQLINQLPDEVKKVREDFFTIGFAWRDQEDKTHGFFIPPFDICSIEFWQQQSFIEK